MPRTSRTAGGSEATQGLKVRTLPSSPTVYSSEVVASEKELLNSHYLVAGVAFKEDVYDDSREDESMCDVNCACMDYCLHGVANSESQASALTADFELDEDEEEDEMGFSFFSHSRSSSPACSRSVSCFSTDTPSLCRN